MPSGLIHSFFPWLLGYGFILDVLLAAANPAPRATQGEMLSRKMPAFASAYHCGDFSRFHID
jgi:hypothetical protein